MDNGQGCSLVRVPAAETRGTCSVVKEGFLLRHDVRV